MVVEDENSGKDTQKQGPNASERPLSNDQRCSCEDGYGWKCNSTYSKQRHIKSMTMDPKEDKLGKMKDIIHVTLAQHHTKSLIPTWIATDMGEKVFAFLHSHIVFSTLEYLSTITRVQDHSKFEERQIMSWNGVMMSRRREESSRVVAKTVVVMSERT